jgi:hypothetical protein
VSDDKRPGKIFISYARNDDAVNPNIRDAVGFVTFLHAQLEDELLKRANHPDLWRDQDRVDHGDQFNEKIAQAINGSEIFLVVLSGNWLASEYCRQEYEQFRKRWDHESDIAVQHRIVVVSKWHVDYKDRPPLLRDQDSFRFYQLNDPRSIKSPDELFGPAGPKDNRYYGLVAQLAECLDRRIKHLDRRKLPPTTSNGRTVFVAKPAKDMRQAYERLVDSLSGAGYKVLPTLELSPDSIGQTRDIIVKALDEAEVSIHLVGENDGFTPDGGEFGITTLQLAEAKTRVPPFIDDSDVRKHFHRIIFAPRILSRSDESQQPGSLRDPMDVLEEFGGHVPGDCVDGDTISNFVKFVGDHLMRTPRKPDGSGDDKTDSSQSGGDAKKKIYLCYPPEDAKYAHSVAVLLKNKNVIPVRPGSQGSEAERIKFDQQLIRECDSVILCWASAPDVWVLANSYRLLDWKSLGRTKSFSRRGLVAGPPPGEPKKEFADLTPENGVDHIVDWTEKEARAEDLDTLI